MVKERLDTTFNRAGSVQIAKIGFTSRFVVDCFLFTNRSRSLILAREDERSRVGCTNDTTRSGEELPY